MDNRLLVLALGMFALGTDSFVMAGVLPQIAHSFDVPIGAAGQMTTVYAITYALMAPAIAAVAAHVPRKALLLSSLATFVVANLATALAPSFGVALATRVLAGLGAAMFAPTATGAAATMVAPEKRGFALAVVITGLSASTALGTPIGALIGGLSDWRWTMGFVSALAAASGLGVAALLSHIPLPPKISLAQRLRPVRDPRVALTLLTTLVYQTGHFIAYTYFTVVFDRVLNHNTLLIGAMLVLWGSSGVVANLATGRLSDTIGSRRVIFALLIVLAATMALLPLASANLWTSVAAVGVWGAVAWGLLAPQQHRLVTVAAHSAPVVLGLNTSGPISASLPPASSARWPSRRSARTLSAMSARPSSCWVSCSPNSRRWRSTTSTAPLTTRSWRPPECMARMRAAPVVARLASRRSDSYLLIDRLVYPSERNTL